MKPKYQNYTAIQFMDEIYDQINECLVPDSVPREKYEKCDQKKIDEFLRSYLQNTVGFSDGDIKKFYYHGVATPAFKKELELKKMEFPKVFGSIQKPDFVILHPHPIVIEYKKGRDNDASVWEKMGDLIAQCICRSYPRQFECVLGIYRDATSKGLVFDSTQKEPEKTIITDLICKDIFIRAVKK